MTVIDLSQTLYNDMPVFPGDPECKIDEIHTIEKEGWRLKYMQLSSHIGTHVDAFAHMDSQGETLDNLPIDRFFGETFLVDINSDFPSNVGLAFSEGEITLGIVEKIKKANPKFVVTGDSALLDVEPERQLLKAGILTITDLVNMSELPKNTKFHFFAVPLKIKDGDGSPVRAFAILDY